MALGGSLPELSIRRPILALVLNLLITLAGLAALYAVEVRELPDVDRPEVSVRVQYPGAAPETMDAEVTSKLEGAIARVSGVRQIESASEENNARINVEFAPDADLDTAAADVREAVNQILGDLPEGIEQLSVYKAEAQPDPVLFVAASQKGVSTEALTERLDTDIVPSLTSVDGVAEVLLFGERERMMRVVVDPLRLNSYDLTMDQVADALREAPFDVPTGSFDAGEQLLLVRADASSVTPEQIESIELGDGLRIGDVAYAHFGPANAESYVRLNGQPVVALGVVRQARSNTIAISNGVRERLETLRQRYPELELSIINDEATFVRGAVSEVSSTLLIAVLVVVGTIWLFLGSLRATLIPSVAIPVAIIGAVASIWLGGFSVNVLTLLALVLVTGLVVDDAIVVLENIQRRRAQGLPSRAAAVLGARQVFFAVLTTSAVLVAVFIPIAFLPGTAGRLFREFGVVLAVAVAISSFVALTLVPALSARLPDAASHHGPIWSRLAAWGEAASQRYVGLLGGLLRWPLSTFGVALALAVGAGLLYQGLGQQLLPEEDRGLLFVDATGPDGTGLRYGERQASRIEAVLQPLVESGEIGALFTIVGRYDPNRVRIIAPLAPWGERRNQQDIVDALQEPLGRIPGARVRVATTNSLDLRGGGGGSLEVALLGEDYDRLYRAARSLADAIDARLPALGDPSVSYQPTQPQITLAVDRLRAADLGVSLQALGETLRVVVDGDELVDLNIGDQAVPIFLEASGTAVNDPSDLNNLFLRSAGGDYIPLGSLVSLREEAIAAELDRHAQRRAVEVDSALRGGYPLGAALSELQAVAEEILPPDITLLPLGEAAAQQETSRDVAMTFGIALLVVFLVLCAQFESITSAAVVMTIVPFGLAAALLAMFITGTSINIYSQVGLVMLIGLMAKNGILLVEFADQLRDRGYAVREAILGSARVRLRPVLMTLLSTVLGALPLILSFGPGAEARRAIGWVVFGGLGIAALFTLLLTPVVYLALAPLAKPRATGAQRLERELAQALDAEEERI